MSRVCAVVLTFNRRDLLIECLEALERQTSRCDRIIVVDNASSDGTADELRRHWLGRVDVQTLSVNVGAAGGFNAAMRAGHADGAELIWIMDDDVIPEPDALERMLAAGETLKKRNIIPPFLISTARSPQGQVTNTPSLDTRKNSISYESWPDLLEHRLMPVARATFVSILVRRETITQYGLPIAAMFIWGEDSEFTIRVTQAQPGFMVGDSRVVHVRQQDGALNIVSETNPTRIAYHFYHIRNDIWMKRCQGSLRGLVKHVIKRAKLALTLASAGEMTKAKVVARGTWAGLWFHAPVQYADPVVPMADLHHGSAANQAGMATLTSSLVN